MGEKNRKTTVIYGTVSLLLFFTLAALTFHDRSDRLAPRKVQVVFFGDSVCGLVRDDTAIPSQVGRLLDKTVFNGSFGGTCVARIWTEEKADYPKDAISLTALTKAVAACDFGAQQTLHFKGTNTEYFEDTVDLLETIDFSSVELVVIEHGLNDYYSGVPVRNEQDPWDERTFTGALRHSLKALKKANPDMRILLVTPTYTWYEDLGLTCEEYDAGYGRQEDYVRAEMEVADEFGVEVLDVYHNVFPHETWEDRQRYTVDGFHPNEAGRTLLAGMIVEYLQQEPAGRENRM